MAGYDENFLDGVRLPLPTFSPQLNGFVLNKPELESGVYANYVNYTVVMNRERRAPIFAALNIDQNKFKVTSRSDRWLIDSRIGGEFQLNNDYYRANPWDRGHLARRASAAWGDNSHQAQTAANETFYYSNAAIQHKNVNRDEWLALEGWVYDLKLDKDGRITSFSGPVYGEYCRSITPEGRETAMIPSAFFKVVCFISEETGKLDVRAFLLLQDNDSMADLTGRSLFNFQNYQVTVTEIERLTGLEFDDEIYQKNPLYYHKSEEKEKTLNISEFPEHIEVNSAEEMVHGEAERDYIDDDRRPIYITAAMVNPETPERENEWVSIINLSGEAIDLDGWTLGDTKRTPKDIGKDANGNKRVLNPGEAVAIKPISPLQLSNKGGTITLYEKPEAGRKQGKRIDRVHYTEEQAKKEDVPVIFGLRLPHQQKTESSDE